MKILIADDQKMIVEEIRDEISKLVPGSFCTGTSDPDDVIPLFEQYRFDVVFIGIRMSGASGLDLAREMMKIYPLTNIIFVTAYPEYAAQAFRIYASDFLEKPVTAEMIEDALAHLRHPVSDITDEMIEREYSGKAVLGKKIQKWREERGISRSELAEALNVDRRTVYRWEKAERTPDIPTYMKILQVLGRNADISGM